MHTRSQPARIGANLIDAGYTVLHGAGTLWRAWCARRQVARLLEADDRMLRDIGLRRSDVLVALSGPLDTDPSQYLIRSRAERRRARRG